MTQRHVQKRGQRFRLFVAAEPTAHRPRVNGKTKTQPQRKHELHEREEKAVLLERGEEEGVAGYDQEAHNVTDGPALILFYFGIWVAV